MYTVFVLGKLAGEEDSEDDEDAETEAGQPGDLMETLGLPAAASLMPWHIFIVTKRPGLHWFFFSVLISAAFQNN